MARCRRPYPASEKMTVKGFAQVKSCSGDRADLEHQAARIAARGVPSREILRAISEGRLEEQINLLAVLEDLTAEDTFIAARLSGISSSCAWGLRMLREMHCQGINIVILEQGIDDTPLGLERLGTLLAVAEWEYADKSDLVKTGQAQAREQGVVLGRPRKLDEKTRRYIFDMLQAGHSKSSLEKSFGVPRRSIGRIEREFANGY